MSKLKSSQTHLPASKVLMTVKKNKKQVDELSNTMETILDMVGVNESEINDISKSVVNLQKDLDTLYDSMCFKGKGSLKKRKTKGKTKGRSKGRTQGRSKGKSKGRSKGKSKGKSKDRSKKLSRRSR